MKNHKSGYFPQKIGVISQEIIDILDLNYLTDYNIYIGETNIEHMQKSHPSDYRKYGKDIALILSKPDYVGINKKDNSIEFVKEYLINDEFVKVAVRVSTSNRLYARSLYVLNSRRVRNFIEKGTLKSLTNQQI